MGLGSRFEGGKDEGKEGMRGAMSKWQGMLEHGEVESNGTRRAHEGR